MVEVTNDSNYPKRVGGERIEAGETRDVEVDEDVVREDSYLELEDEAASSSTPTKEEEEDEKNDAEEESSKPKQEKEEGDN